ncbi:nuclear transport factor 2 family protein [Corticibacterium sp. UT-5YL-CI-8]|nr:nuclear transport factor 2 family protein [Tianweitania sp. UT-5YL-CI-8]
MSEEVISALELRALADRYAMAVDRGDGTLFAAQFTEDGVLNAPRGRFVGREQLATVPPMMVARYERTYHAVVGQVPVFGHDKADAQTYTFARHYYRSGGEEFCYEMTVRYEDQFQRSGGRWLLSCRSLILVGETVFKTAVRPSSIEPSKVRV